VGVAIVHAPDPFAARSSPTAQASTPTAPSSPVAQSSVPVAPPSPVAQSSVPVAPPSPVDDTAAHAPPSSPVGDLTDPFAPSSLVERLAARLAPTHRVLSVTPREGVAYQVAAADFIGVLDQFGFASPILVGERVGCVPLVLVAAWYPERLGGVILVDPTSEPPAAVHGSGPEAWSLRDCPPDLGALQARLTCKVLETSAQSADLMHTIEAFLQAQLP